jgi:hypothetical protein
MGRSERNKGMKDIYGRNDTCIRCGKPLVYDISEDMYEFCYCEEKKALTIPSSKDNKSIADQFEIDIQKVIDSYCGQGVTLGTIIGALQNRLFNLSLNIHMKSILEVLKRELNK